MFANLCTLALVVELFGYYKSFIETVPKYVFIVVMLVILLTNYFLFIKNGKFQKLDRKYSGENVHKRNLKAILLWLYSLGSILAGYLVAFLLR
jgi:hypothetical protein